MLLALLELYQQTPCCLPRLERARVHARTHALSLSLAIFVVVVCCFGENQSSKITAGKFDQLLVPFPVCADLNQQHTGNYQLWLWIMTHDEAKSAWSNLKNFEPKNKLKKASTYGIRPS